MGVVNSNISSKKTVLELEKCQEILFEFEKKDLQKAMKDTVGLASRLLRKEIEPKFFKRYRLRGTKLNPANTESYNLTKRVGRNGVRSIGYYLHGRNSHKWANVYIKILNWYEEDVIVGVGLSGRKKPYTRKGTHLFTRAVAPIAEPKLNLAAEMVALQLRSKAKEKNLL